MAAPLCVPDEFCAWHVDNRRAPTLWADELLTYGIANLPNFSDVCSVLLRGQEQSRPGLYAIVRASLHVFGNENIAVRLPAVMGCLVMILALFKIVPIRLSPVYEAFGGSIFDAR